jgi:riboflavin kinase/FMN adenylyltransferase
MQLIRGLHNLSLFCEALANGCALTIGNFDGVHLGHQQVLRQLHHQAQALGLPSVVMVFEPLPMEYFAPQKAPVRLMNLREKIVAFRCTEVDYVLVCRFDQKFAELSAGQFIDKVLIEGLNVKHLIVGDDFRFGRQRQGDFELLQATGAQKGFAVTQMPTFEMDGERVSSTAVRQALAELPPHLERVQKLLGRPFSFNGRVIHGQKLGRTIGFPTLNLNPKRLQMPVQGVFAVSVCGLSEQAILGVANIGVRPTVNGLQPSIEVHLFDWQKEVYGAHVEVLLHHFIRPEMKFNGLEALTAQIQQDVNQAKEFFTTFSAMPCEEVCCF